MHHQPIATPFGTLAACWSSSGLYSCGFREESCTGVDACQGPRPESARSPESARKWAQRLESAIAGYFQGEILEWDLQALDWSGVPAFHQVVLRACARIPAGATTTYGALAAQVGSPGAARAVGSAMARNRWPILIPCHRVLGSTGKLTGYSGAGGLETKRQLLALEARPDSEERPSLLAFSKP